MRIIDVNVIRVVLKQEFCESLRLQDYLNDADNGDFNKVCYDTVKSFLGEDHRTEVFFSRCACMAYELAWSLLVNKEYNKDWGSRKGESFEIVMSPTCDVEFIDDKPLRESKFLRIMLPILWHILQKTDLVRNGYYDKEAEIIAQAGRLGAVTIATNMAGRGTDIKLGEGVVELGGLCVIGTERHESRRIFVLFYSK